MSWQSVSLAQAQSQLKDKWERVPFWVDSEATTAINEALREWNLLTGMWKRRVTIQTQASQPWITVPSTMVYNTKINFGQVLLNSSALGDLDNYRQGWELETTVSGGDVPASPKLWAPAGLNLFAIWPADAIGGHSLVVDGVRSTPQLSLPADFIDIGEHELDAILGMALHIAAFKLGSPLFGGTLGFYRDFLIAAADQNLRLKASALFRTLMGLDTNRSTRPMRVAAAAASPAPAPGGPANG